MSEAKQLEAGQQLIKKSMNDLVEQQKVAKQPVAIQARQEFHEEYSEEYEEEYEEETFIDELGNATTTSTSSSSEASEHKKSADVKVKASGLNPEQLQALTECAGQAGQLALTDKPAN